MGGLSLHFSSKKYDGMLYLFASKTLQLDFLRATLVGCSSTRAIGDIFSPETSFGKVGAFGRQVFAGKTYTDKTLVHIAHVLCLAGKRLMYVRLY